MNARAIRNTITCIVFAICAYAAMHSRDAAIGSVAMSESAPPRPSGDSFDLEQRRRDHWAWQPIRSPTLPSVRDAHWVHDPIDCFVLERLERTGLVPAPSADRRTLIRRLYFDLTG